MSNHCPTCGQPFPPDVVQWRWVEKLNDGQWEASVQMGQWRGWAIQKSEELAKEMALARLHYAKDYLGHNTF